MSKHSSYPAPASKPSGKLFNSQGYSLDARDKSNLAVQQKAHMSRENHVKPRKRDNMLKSS